MVSPQAKREAVTMLLTERDFGVTRACGLVGISRSLYRYRSRRPDSVALRSRIEENAAIKRRYGYRRVYLRLQREGWQDDCTRECVAIEVDTSLTGTRVQAVLDRLHFVYGPSTFASLQVLLPG
jgi:hypothetical protein